MKSKPTPKSKRIPWKRQSRRGHLSNEEKRALAAFYAGKIKEICDNMCYRDDISDASIYVGKLAKLLPTIPPDGPI
jgi:hypothetical protein